MPETSVGGMVPAVFGPYGSLQGLCRSLLKSRAEPGHRGPMCLKGRLFLEQVGVPLLQMPSATHWGLGQVCHRAQEQHSPSLSGDLAAMNAASMQRP